MSAPLSPRKRVLLFAEAVTLAHVARPLCMLRGLDRGRYDVAIAAPRSAAPHLAAAGVEHIEIESLAAEVFLAALAKGRPLYSEATLRRYVEADLRAIEHHRADAVVGDFRLSLSVSARLAKVPYLTIASAYWSPFYSPPAWLVPALPLTRALPLPWAQAAFNAFRPLAFAAHCAPLNAVRRHYGLPALPRDLRIVYTDADRVAYSDLPEIFPMRPLPPTHGYVGAALWEPDVALPDWWLDMPADRPVVYITMGSSGNAALLPGIIAGLRGVHATLLVATASSAMASDHRGNVYAAPYLPGIKAAQRARVVICNGGSLTAYQALAAGVPVLGIASNLDQFLNMQGFERAGAGRLLRADRFSSSKLRTDVDELLAGRETRAAIDRLGAALGAIQFEDAAAAMLAELLD